MVVGIMVGQQMLCSKQGFQECMKALSLEHRIRDIQCGCEVMIYVSLDMNTMKWHIAKFVVGHNHLLVSAS